MPQVCPCVTPYTEADFAEQYERVKFASRLHLDLMDGDFVETKSPELETYFWDDDKQIDLHLMYRHPDHYLEVIERLRPSLVIVHAEAEINHNDWVAKMREMGIKAGIALLPETPANFVWQMSNRPDHVLIFSGHLGHYGGAADLGLGHKAQELKDLDLELGWDGGINDVNARDIADFGISVLNVGGFIQKSNDAHAAYVKILKKLEL